MSCYSPFMARVLVAALLLGTLAHAQTPRVRKERGRFWIQCQSASLDEMVRELAALSPMELWLEEGLSGKRVTASIEGATLKQALEELFEEATDVNYVFTFDPANPERVTKIYAGGGGGRLGREPTVASAEEEEPPEVQEDPQAEGEYPLELDPETLSNDPDAQEGMDALRQLFEQQQTEGVETPELEELLRGIPELQEELPPELVQPAKPPKKKPLR